MKKLTSEISRHENEGEIEITVKIDGYDDHKKEDVVNYIDTELLYTLAKYVRKKEKLAEIISRTEDLFGLIVALDDEDYGYFASTKDFYKIVCYHHGKNNYNVEVRLTRKK